MLGSDRGGIGGCWFIMALALIKVVFQFVPRKWLWWVVLPGSMALHLYLGMEGYRSTNAYLNACGGFLFFMVGVLLQSYREVLSRNLSLPRLVFGLAVSVAITQCVAVWNGKPGMHFNGWGNNYALFVAGGLSGSAIVYFFSIMLSRYNGKSLRLLSSGTIVILGLHMHIIRLYRIFVPFAAEPSVWDYLAALVLLLLFVPIIHIIKRYFPVLMGARVNKLSSSFSVQEKRR